MNDIKDEIFAISPPRGWSLIIPVVSPVVPVIVAAEMQINYGNVPSRGRLWWLVVLFVIETIVITGPFFWPFADRPISKT